MGNSNLYQTLRKGFQGHMDSPCIATPAGENFSYAEMDRWSARMALALAGLGAIEGDRILVQVSKSPANVALYLACLRGGFVLIPLNTAYTAAEISYFIGDAAPHIVICDPQSEASIAPLVPDAGTLLTLGGGSHCLLPLAEQQDAPEAGLTLVCERGPEDIAAIVYTSGTTGRSKGAMLSHANLASNALTLHSIWGFERGDTLLHALPIFHVHGLFIALNTAFLNASKVIFLEKFDTARVLASLPLATIMMGVPTFYTRLLASPAFDRRHFDHMRLFISGSAPLTEQTFEEFEARTGQRILERYGMTETGMITSNPLNGERVAGTVGFALPGVELRISTAEGTVLPPGEVGIVEVRGPNVFAGYWNMPEKTADEFRAQQWFITGDMARMDSEGRVSIVGRGKDLIISGGYNVYPKEVELCLDDTDEITESAVIGVPHPDYGEAVVAVCVPATGTLPNTGGDEAVNSRVITAIAEQLAAFKRPKHIVFVDELPRNAMGKVQKNLLRDTYNKLFTRDSQSGKDKL